ncbi:hypothetical protein GCM10010478_00380 [Streptomyces erythrogriseus]|uniref:Uncharacterized protein n=2 Tax=Streptomyces griseoincarnatus group TaxID=2867193 RepID=A0ABN3WAH9_9ACTN|nr:hypothetical protein GCM10010265_57430 [Streptomyces griseoincarnatus]GGT52415.1 hypothetical protein GCM10010287_28180 [Streptomyces variabilis]
MVATDVPSFFLRVGGWEVCADAEWTGGLCLSVGERPVTARHLVGGLSRVSASLRAGGGRRVLGAVGVSGGSGAEATVVRVTWITLS